MTLNDQPLSIAYSLKCELGVQCEALHLLLRGTIQCTDLHASRLCPLVLHVKEGWRHGRTLLRKEGKVSGSGLVAYTARERC